MKNKIKIIKMKVVIFYLFLFCLLHTYVNIFNKNKVLVWI